MQTMYWLIAFIVLLVIEFCTLGLTTIWFAAGALLAFVAGLLGQGTVVQFAVFLVSSLILLVLTRPWAMKHFNTERKKTNLELIKGEHGLVIEEIDGLTGVGRVRVKGQEWAAKPAGKNRVIPEGREIVVVEIQGVKVVVEEEGTTC